MNKLLLAVAETVVTKPAVLATIPGVATKKTFSFFLI